MFETVIEKRIGWCYRLRSITFIYQI